ncbi:hypothetical protein HYALB_00008850 [Hymenoscyphus albidus]|uniref:Transmembrane protein n=1 Tax=Hymenoscyphus albidus TaxID=595503 RepID=A0A9N9LKN1_9HELO|nr:hypothetical protein HYALB_00008850 [Hymenoscyphus albidus]
MKRRKSTRSSDAWPVHPWQEPVQVVDWSKAAELLLHITLTIIATLPLAFASFAAHWKSSTEVGGFSSTVWMLFTSRASILLNLGLASLWATSPLAGQASLRILYTQNVTTESADAPWEVMNTNIPGPWAKETLVTKRCHGLSTNYISAMEYGGALNLDDQNNAFDSRSFPLLPSADPFLGRVQSSEVTETNFSALQGIVVYGPRFSSEVIRLSAFRTESNVTFPVSLFKFKCPAVEVHLIADYLATRDLSNAMESGPSFLAKNGFFLQFNESDSGRDKNPSRITFGSFYDDSHFIKWECDISLNTRLPAMQRQDWKLPLISTQFQPVVTDPDAPQPRDGHSLMCTLVNASASSISSFEFLRKALPVIFSAWPRLDPATGSVPSVTETYLATGKAWKGKTETSTSYDLSKIDRKTFENRLTTAFNTLLLTSLQVARLGTTRAEYATLASSATPLLFTPFDIIKCNWAFFAILVSTSIILIACSALNIWLRFKITTPDVLGYVSSSTIDNPYFQIQEAPPDSGSTLDGHKRTRLLKNTRVILGDVQHDLEVGKLALSCEDEGVRKFDTERLYV